MISACLGHTTKGELLKKYLLIITVAAAAITLQAEEWDDIKVLH